MYLFANADHFYEARQVIDEVVDFLPPDARVLEFGGGTGNLSRGLAARGFRVHYHELSARLPARHYDAICAFDVFEPLPDLPKVVEELASALADVGILIDTPSFSVGLANPMHHEDPGLASLGDQGLALDRTLPAFRVWKKRAQ